MYRIGVDLGGTSVSVGVVDENNQIVMRTFAPTGKGKKAEELIDEIYHLIESGFALSGIEKSECIGIGIASPGTCDPETGKVYRAYNLGLDDVDICTAMKWKTGLETRLANDGDAAALGEVIGGSAKGKKNVLFVCLGTGVGAGIIVDGKIYPGCGRGGIEAGHHILVPDGEKCSCGAKGCFEAYASATALIKRADRAAKANPESALNKYSELNGKNIFDTADAGDETAVLVVDEYIKYLSMGLTNLINILDPEAVVVGGGIGNRGEALLAPVREYVAEHIFGGLDRRPPEFYSAKLGNDAGIIGAAALWLSGFGD